MPTVLRSKWALALIGLLVVLLLVWFVVVDLVAERMIEKHGSRKVGARVELSKADVSLFPASIELTGLTVANPHRPMENALDVRRVFGTLELGPLFSQRIIVPELAMEGVRLGTERSRSGALPGAPAPEKPEATGICSEAQMPSLTLPDVDAILEQANLESVETIQDLKADLESAKETWRQKLAELPDREALTGYRERLNALSESKSRSLGSLLSSGSEALSVAKELRSDLERLKEARQGFQNLQADLRQRLEAARQAPQQDVGRLMDTYGLSPEGLGNLSALLFGEKLCTWSTRAIDWYQRIAPMLEGRGAGGQAEPPPSEPGQKPDFLVREATVSVSLAGGSFSGLIENITTNQQAWGTPLTFSFSGSGLQGLQSVTLNGSMDHTKPQMAKDVLSMALKGLNLENVSLTESERWPLKLQEALLNLDLTSEVMGGSLMTEAAARFESADFQLPVGEGAGALVETLSGVLRDVSGLRLNAQLTGSLEKFALRLSSDLDQTLKRAAGKALQQQTAQLEQRLRQAVTARIQDPMNAVQGQFSDYSALGQTLNQRLQLGQSILSESGVSF